METSCTLDKKPCYLPFGKAGDTTSPALSRVRGSILQLRPRRLGSAASSTFATLGFSYRDEKAGLLASAETEKLIGRIFYFNIGTLIRCLPVTFDILCREKF